MSYNITQEDIRLLMQRDIRYLVRLEIYKNEMKMAEVYGVSNSGSISINAESDVRRTGSFTLIPNKYKKENIEISEDGLIWLNNTLRLSIGIYNYRTKSYVFYKVGTYVFTDSSGTTDISNNSISINCADYMSKLDGTKNGQIGALTTTIPAYKEDPETGEVIKHNIIREAMIEILTRLGQIKDYVIDDIGEYKGMPQYNSEWEKYRQTNDLWNTVPYDLEFSCGDTILSILQTLRDLYPNYEMFFDESNIFYCQLIPSSYEDDIVLDNNFIKKVLISENPTIDITVKNICEVWGEVIDTEFYTEECVSDSGTYICTVKKYDEKYYAGDTIAVKVDAENISGQKININNLGAMKIYDENTEEPIAAGLLKPNIVYVFKVNNRRIEGNNELRIYFLGHWQAHAMSVLTDGTVSDETFTTSDGKQLHKYSEEYFREVYNCETVEFNIVKDSPFTIQKIGEILDVKTGGEYENITSDALAKARAHYENWKNCRLTDSISITTLLIPFLDVNQKISYQREDSDIIEQYIIKSVSHDLGAGTSTISMYKFYPIYEENNLLLNN